MNIYIYTYIYIAIENGTTWYNMAIEIVRFPIENMFFHKCLSLSESNRREIPHRTGQFLDGVGYGRKGLWTKRQGIRNWIITNHCQQKTSKISKTEHANSPTHSALPKPHHFHRIGGSHGPLLQGSGGCRRQQSILSHSAPRKPRDLPCWWKIEDLSRRERNCEL